MCTALNEKTARALCGEAHMSPDQTAEDNTEGLAEERSQQLKSHRYLPAFGILTAIFAVRIVDFANSITIGRRCATFELKLSLLLTASLLREAEWRMHVRVKK
jgi:hypothetical protein